MESLKIIWFSDLKNSKNLLVQWFEELKIYWFSFLNHSKSSGSVVARRDVSYAQKLLEDVRVLEWVEDQNSKQGVAPPQRFVWEHRCSHRLCLDVGWSSQSAQAPNSVGAVKWLQRFRRRWDLQLGRQPVQEIVPLQVLRQKARQTTT